MQKTSRVMRFALITAKKQVQGDPEKINLETMDSFVFNSNFSGSPCISCEFSQITLLHEYFVA